MAGDCTPETCPVEGGYVSYDPSIAGNTFLLAAFATLIPLGFIFGWRFRTKGYTITTTAGLLLQVLGFVGRLLLNGKRSGQGPFALYLLGTVLGPTLFAGGLFAVLPHVLTIYGERACSFRSGHVLMLFSLLALLVVLLEIAGVVFAVLGKNGATVDQTTNVLVAGLAIQIGALITFMGLHLWFTLGLHRMKVDLDDTHAHIYRSSKFKRFLIIMQLAAILLLATTLFRVVEMASGLGGSLAQSEAAVMTMVGGIPLVAMILLTIFHPGPAFGDAWGQTTPQYVHQRQIHPEATSPVTAAAPYEPTYVTSPVNAAQPPAPATATHDRFQFRPVAPRPYDGANTNNPRTPYDLYPIESRQPPPPPPRTPGPAASQKASPTRSKPANRTPTDTLVDNDALW